jgi:hypothetical protein
MVSLDSLLRSCDIIVAADTEDNDTTRWKAPISTAHPLSLQGFISSDPWLRTACKSCICKLSALPVESYSSSYNDVPITAFVCIFQ